MSVPVDPQRRVRKAVIIGAGPVGCLAAISFAKMGWLVEIYDGRPDIRLPSSKAAAQLRSINLAISARGIAALHAIDPAATARFLKTVIPMRGRMIHDIKGNLDSQLYDRDGQCINSIDRALLNGDLLEQALAVPNVRIFFQHKVSSIDFDGRILTAHDAVSEKDIQVQFDFCVGADGSYSVVRRQLMRVVRMNYEQQYVPHDYLELKIPAGPPSEVGGDSTFLLDPNHLHIWPRHSFMLIALPNKDKTFTCTLFAPTADFARLDDPQEMLRWFRRHFSDAVSLIGEETLLNAFEHNPRSSLISVKATPYHYRDRVVILGDAAHSMVPFYGQGLNCGLEDVRVLHILLRGAGVNPTYSVPEGRDDFRLARALSCYSESRHDDLLAICDLAMANYAEMRHDVTTPAYRFRKALDNILYALSSPQVNTSALGPALSRVPFPTEWPAGWLPQYTMVTFRPDISYATVKRKVDAQNRALKYAGWASMVMGAGVVAITYAHIMGRLRNRA